MDKRPIPNRAIEGERQSVIGEVKIYQLSSEELERYRAMKPDTATTYDGKKIANPMILAPMLPKQYVPRSSKPKQDNI